MERFRTRVENLITTGKDKEEWKQLALDMWDGRIRIIIRDGGYYAVSVEDEGRVKSHRFEEV